MYGYRDILVSISAEDGAESVLSAALLVAKRFCGHLDVIHVHPSPACILPVPVVSADVAGFVVNDVIRAEEKNYDENAGKTRAFFEKYAVDHCLPVLEQPQAGLKEVTARYREIFGAEDEVLSWCSRVSDLTVLPRPDLTAPTADAALDVLNAALMESGSAIMIAPRGVVETIGKRVIIAWDGSEESGKAVTMAMPFLIDADEVVILETDLPNEEWADARALADRLAWHGIDASIVKLPETSSVAAKGLEIVRQACGRFDLLVSGAFTQSTMRRWILGSMTKYLIANADIALFMTH